MWQQRGLDFPLYSVLSRHHSETNDFSLSFLSFQEKAAGGLASFPSDKPLQAGNAGNPIAKLILPVQVPKKAASREEGLPLKAKTASNVVVRRQTSTTSLHESEALLLRQKGTSRAQLISSENGANVSEENAVETSAKDLERATADELEGEKQPPKQSSQKHPSQKQRCAHQSLESKEREEIQQVREQQDEQDKQPILTRCQQWAPSAVQRKSETRANQDAQQQQQPQTPQQKKPNERDLPGYIQRVAVPLQMKSEAAGEAVHANELRGDLLLKLEGGCETAVSGGAHCSSNKHREAFEKKIVACGSSIPRVPVSVVQPPSLISQNGKHSSPRAAQSQREGCLYNLSHSRDETLAVCAAPAKLLAITTRTPDAEVAAAFTAFARHAAGKGGEGLRRAPSLRDAVVPSFRVLILFGSTSGVSAAVAFSIFHTFVHRLLSSSKRLQGSCLPDQMSVSPIPLSPRTAMSSRKEASAARPRAASRANRAAASGTRASPSVKSAVCDETSGAVKVHGVKEIFSLIPTHQQSKEDSSIGTSGASSNMHVRATAYSSSCQLMQSEEDDSCASRDEAKERLESCCTDTVSLVGRQTPSIAVSRGSLNSEVLNDEQKRFLQQTFLRDQQRAGHQEQQFAGRDEERQCEERQASSQEGVELSPKQQRHETLLGNHPQVSLQGEPPRQNAHRLGGQSSSVGDHSSAEADVRSSVFSENRLPVLEKREAAAQAADVASMGLKAAAAKASAALKAAEDRDALFRAAATDSAKKASCEEESRRWFMDAVQIGRVGVFIQSMQYFTLEDFLGFVEESRLASAAVVAAAAQEAELHAAELATCRATEAGTGVATFRSATTTGKANTTSGFRGAKGAADAGVKVCRRGGGKSPASCAVEEGAQIASNIDGASVETSGCSGSHPSLAAAGAREFGSSTGSKALSSVPHTLLLYCISTDTGGAPPPSAAPLFSEIFEAADDFRVGRASLRGCCVAGVGCGSTDYADSTYCKPAKTLMTPLHRLGAQKLMQQPLLLLSDTSAAATTEMKLARWKQQLVQQVERLLQAGDEQDVQRLLLEAKNRAFSLQQKQELQYHRQQRKRQQQHLRLRACSEMCECATEGRLADEEAKGEARLFPRGSQGCGIEKIGSRSKNSSSDLNTVTDTSLDHEKESATDETSFADEDGSSWDREPSPFPAGKHEQSTVGGSSFAGIDSGVCGGLEGEDVEDMGGAEEGSGKSGLKPGATNSLQSEQVEASPLRWLTQKKESGDWQGAEQARERSPCKRLDTAERRRQIFTISAANGGGRRRQQQQLGDKRHAMRELEKMVKPGQAEKLIKEGYRLIGTHSAVKLCRWTKSQLRGRGGCYKHTFYGITSSQCMEMTPSLACANKCIFCWRHHKNPVGTSWRWQMDEENFVVEEAIAQHFKAIKELKGMAEVKQDRLRAAQDRLRHCALSLVGEPIMYPRIAALVKLLHEKHISTFLVTNAQFPDALASLPPVTQLYLSVDAASAADLKALDQPLFRDYWERLIKCMEILRLKRQRTVYRLTLVGGYNMPDLAALEKAQRRAQLAEREETGIGLRSPQERGQVHQVRLSSLNEQIASEDAKARVNTLSIHRKYACDTATAAHDKSSAAVRATYAASRPAFVSFLEASHTKSSAETKNSQELSSSTIERVKGNEMDGRSAASYAALILKGLPDFIEVKAVTYAGTSKQSKITMKNVPWHEQVVAFCKELCAALPKGTYELACAHRHSCCVLIARTEYKKNGQWHTWINYEKFHELAITGRTDFTGADYCAPTPAWAIFGHAAAGFSPFEARIYTKGKQKRLQTSAAAGRVRETHASDLHSPDLHPEKATVLGNL